MQNLKTFHHDKSRGQNFLVDENVLQKIVAAAELKKDDEIIEIGAGEGKLTKELAKNSGHVFALEIDGRLIPTLQNKLEGFANVEIFNEDILKFFPSLKKYKIVANIPYCITSAVLEKFFSAPIKPSLIVLLVQKEVAERICATPGEMSLLSVIAQYYGEPKIVSLVPAHAFFPVPKVESAILKINLRCPSLLKSEEEKVFLRIVKVGFSQKRKMLKKNLKGILPAATASLFLTSLGLKETVRAEDLSLQNWLDLAKKVCNEQKI